MIVMKNVNEINSLALAYLGDSIYELYIRTYLIDKGINKVNTLQEEAKKYVSAKSQALILNKINEYLTNEEIDVVKRARNHKSHKSPKNTDIVTYKLSTGLEALFGYLFLTKQNKRIDELMNLIVGEKICISMERM